MALQSERTSKLLVGLLLNIRWQCGEGIVWHECLRLCLKYEQNQKIWLSPIIYLKDFILTVLPISFGLQAESIFGLNNIYHSYLFKIDKNLI